MIDMVKVAPRRKFQLKYNDRYDVLDSQRLKMTDSDSKFMNGFRSAFESGRYMAKTPKIENLSVTSVMLSMYFKDILLAKGTGWFWSLGHEIALVTAWHNLSGLHHTLRKHLHRHGGAPDRIKVRYVSKTPLTFQEFEFPLYIDGDMTNPRWFVHPVCGNLFDMAFLRILPSELGSGPINLH